MKLNYRKLGQGKPLFILHGLFGLSDNWATVGKILSQSFEVYLIDLRNHGGSPHEDEWTYEAMSEDIKVLVEEVSNHKSQVPSPKSQVSSEQPEIILMGHSLGGKVAMQFASAYPEMLEKLIVVDMAPKDYPGKQFDFIEKLLPIDLAKMKSRKEAEAELRKIIKDEATVQLLLKNIQWTENGSGSGNSSTLEWKFNLKVIAENQDKIGKTFSIKNKIDTPALFIRGERSNYITDTDIAEIKKIFPNSEVKTIAGAGHWAHADKPEEFTKVVLEFI